MRRRLLIVGVNACLCFMLIAGTEALIRTMRPDLTRHSLLLSIFFQHAESWAQPSAEFHHTGPDRMALDFNPSFRPGSKRILVIGDSFAWGQGVSAEQAFPALLSTMLPADFEVHLLACSSYSPVIYRRILATALQEHVYAAIVIFVDQTDPADDLIYEQDLVAGATPLLFDAAKIGSRKREIEQALNEMSHHLAGWRGGVRRLALVNWLVPLRMQDFLPPNGFAKHAPQLQRNQFIRDFNVESEKPDSREMEALLTAHVQEIMDRAGETPLFLAANPWQFQVSNAPGGATFIPPPYPKANLLEGLLQKIIAAKESVHLVPLTSAFAAVAQPSLLFLPAGEIHWSAAGHDLAARVLSTELRHQLLLESATPSSSPAGSTTTGPLLTAPPHGD
jgi:hypothetical protein